MWVGGGFAPWICSIGASESSAASLQPSFLQGDSHLCPARSPSLPNEATQAWACRDTWWLPASLRGRKIPGAARELRDCPAGAQGGIVAGFGFCAAPRASRKQPCLQGSSSSNRACEQGTANPPGADGGACLLCSFSTGRSQGQGHNVQRAELALDTGQPVPVKAGNAVGAGPSEKRRGGNSESLPTGHPPPLCVLPRRKLSA